MLYQAGADPHVEDPLGGWMTTEQLARRDQIVFETAEELGLPVAWNLAGGYQRDTAGGIEPVLEIHRNTMKACVSVYGRVSPLLKAAPDTEKVIGTGRLRVGAAGLKGSVKEERTGSSRLRSDVAAKLSDRSIHGLLPLRWRSEFLDRSSAESVLGA